MYTLVSAALWVVGKALAPVADGLLEAWGATKNLGLNIEALRMELLLVKATLELAASKQICGQAMEELLGKLRDSAQSAEDLLDELDYFRIHDELHGTCDAADHHAKGGVHDFAFNARHTAEAVGKKVSCCAWPRARQRSNVNSSLDPKANQESGSHVSSSSEPKANQEVSGCIPKLGKILPCSSSPNVRDEHSGQPTLTLCGAPQRETPMLGFNRVDVSEKMKLIVEQLQPVRKEVTKILQCCDHMAVLDITRNRPITSGQSIEPKLYGRDHIMDTIIHDMIKGKYHSKDLTVLPVVGPGGLGKTTLIQHIYKNQEVQNHFQVVIWVCVSLNFSLNKLLEEIKACIPRVEGEIDGRPEELIEQRLKSKRFLLVLDDMWEISNEDDWKRLLLPLKASQQKGSIILLTTRFPAIAKMVETQSHIELKGLESKEFRKLFLAFVFGDEPIINDHSFLLETGNKIMEKLKGSPLAAKTVGKLLRKGLNLSHWIKVLESKEWDKQTSVNDIMPALKLSYDYLPYQQQQCFSSAALFPEDHKYRTIELINLWIGLDILQPVGQNQTLEDIGLSNLSDLVAHGFFKKEETYGHYIMHDLLHDLALKVASHECLIVHHSNVGSIEIYPSIYHLVIIVNVDDTMSREIFKSQLRKLKTRLKVKRLHTLMLFGEMDESFANILGDFFKEANALRVLHLDNMPYSGETMLHDLPTLVHLRYVCLGTKYGREMHLPLPISRFYHLKILDLGSWYHILDLPKDLNNLAALRHFYTRSDNLHSHIHNVGKLKLLQELKVFRVNKESEGFEPSQLEHLTELRELGIYNLENIRTKEEAARAKLIEKNYLESLTLCWDGKGSNTEPRVEAAILESLQPHRYLQKLCIKGHKCPSCPTWLGTELVVEVLQSLHLSGVSWEYLPPLGKMWDLRKLVLENIAALKDFVIEQCFWRLIKLELVDMGSFEKWVPSQDTHHMFPLLQTLHIRNCPKLLELPFSNHTVCPSGQDWSTDWFPKLQELVIIRCPELLLVARIPWTKTLRYANIRDVKLLGVLEYNSQSCHLVNVTGKDEMHNLDQVLAFNKLAGLESMVLKRCPPLEWKQLVMLTSLKKLVFDSADALVGPLGVECDVEWQHPVERLDVQESCGASGKELTKLLTHLPRLSMLCIINCENITQLAVGVDLERTTSAASEVEQHKDEDGLLLFLANLSDSLRELRIRNCPEVALLDPPFNFFPALQSLERLQIFGSPKILPAGSPSCCCFPSSLQELDLWDVQGMGTLEPLSNLTSLTKLRLGNCRKDLRCKGLGPLLTARGKLRDLIVIGSPRFFAGWDPNPRRVQLQDELGQGQKLQQLGSFKLSTDDHMGLLAAPICSFLSYSLTHLRLSDNDKIERFTMEQEDALHLLTSLQRLDFGSFSKLQSLPAGLHKFTNLKKLGVMSCPGVRSLPKDGLPKSLQELDVSRCDNAELIQQCRGLVGTIPKIKLQPRD
ncbi:putative disease resistance protein RGA3 [Triticum urartu]|uniref:AAA+ ATPase domain-containing protein n=1 Tax=Triticum urartu TaxID=4572 RepID=A0A8R7R7S3_TRIUA|nr:putative disease resistance protein RGA3 [Triticum urartu]XP_048539523.1 putative disease resistance protein RGA3 [Triticum urartu]XP_048539525.1 putative disease resistance protein RGA3 [Triticum urartu]XP_048539526.1 putative disease resistance protein RGA3 [Triticum urartu]XP_048539527.1 putative disease resistance protein RGA3 [Triticum urartu]XP_048539528.1 putative disease resistance protein RGA3 [Triticum urartu]XP_048539529.1 putative disease resistance protein RGA3 [Triticum urart